MAVRTDFTAGEVLAAADLNDTFGSKLATTVTTKGDLVTRTSTQPTRLGVGSNGQVLTADSSTASGLIWASVASETWTTFTPTIANLTLGNGTIPTARYIKIGEFVYVQVVIVFGSTTSITGGALDLTWPVSGTTLGGTPFIGLGTLQDATGSLYPALIVEVGETARIARLFVTGTEIVSAGVSATAPFIWTTNDRMTYQIQYKAA